MATIFLVDHGHGYGQAVMAFGQRSKAEQFIQDNLEPNEKIAQSEGYSNGWGINEVEFIP